MNQISVPYHLILPTIISLICIALIFVFFNRTFKSKRKKTWIALSVFFAIYAFIVSSAAITDIKYQRDLAAFDLNHDGLFSDNEITSSQEEAMFRLTNDVGRNFTIFTGAFIAGIFGLFIFLII